MTAAARSRVGVGDSPPLLSAKNVTKRFGGLVAVSDINFDIPEGSIVSLIGPNGAGKTTFFNIIAGIYDPTAGRILVRDRTMVARSRRATRSLAPSAERRGVSGSPLSKAARFSRVSRRGP